MISVTNFNFRQGLGAVKLGGVKVKKISPVLNMQSETETMEVKDKLVPTEAPLDNEFSSHELMATDKQLNEDVLVNKPADTDFTLEDNKTTSTQFVTITDKQDDYNDETSVMVPTKTITESGGEDLLHIQDNIESESFGGLAKEEVETEPILECVEVADTPDQVTPADDTEAISQIQSLNEEEKKPVEEMVSSNAIDEHNGSSVEEPIGQIINDAKPEDREAQRSEAEQPIISEEDIQQIPIANSEEPHIEEIMTEDLSSHDDHKTVKNRQDDDIESSSNADHITEHDGSADGAETHHDAHGGEELTTSHSSSTLHMSTEESITPQGSSADLIAKSSSSESTVVDQVSVVFW